MHHIWIKLHINVCGIGVLIYLTSAIVLNCLIFAWSRDTRSRELKKLILLWNSKKGYLCLTEKPILQKWTRKGSMHYAEDKMSNARVSNWWGTNHVMVKGMERTWEIYRSWKKSRRWQKYQEIGRAFIVKDLGFDPWWLKVWKGPWEDNRLQIWCKKSFADCSF